MNSNSFYTDRYRLGMVGLKSTLGCLLLGLIIFVSPVNALVILQYHHIDTDTPAITSTPPEVFKAHLEYLKAHNYEVVVLEDALQAKMTGRDPLERTVAITFDDAFTSIFETAFPLLQEYQYPFTIFVSTDFISKNSKQYLSWQQLSEMAEAGATIANHTRSHLHMVRKKSGESNAAWLHRQTQEVEQAQNIIETHLGRASRMLALPYGEYEPQLIYRLTALSYSIFGQQSGAVSVADLPAVIPRFPMGGRYSDLATFGTKVNTRAFPDQGKVINPILHKHQVRPLLGLSFPAGNWRLKDLACYGPGGRLALKKTSASSFATYSLQDLTPGRSRYNCTMPDQNGRFYWFSQIWMMKRADGAWYPEP
jgi:poly-beta-1,6-N-acetyl-D-glucosamine N-deacetylase